MNRRSKPRALSCEPLPLSHNCRTYLRMLQDEMDSQFGCMVQWVASRGPQPKVEPSVPPSTSAVLGACCLYGLRNRPDSPQLSLSSGSAYSESGGTTDTRSQSPEDPLDDSTADMQAITLLQECQALFLEEWQSRNRQAASSSCSQWVNSSSSSALLPAGNHVPSVVQPQTEHHELTDAAAHKPTGPDLVMPPREQDPSASGSTGPALSGSDSHLSTKSCRDSLKAYAVPDSPALTATVEERISTPLAGAAPLSEDHEAACERYSASQAPLRHRISKDAADSAAADSAAATEAVDKETATQAAATGTLTDRGPQHTGDSASSTATLASAALATQDAPQPKSAGCWTCRLRRKACDRRHPTCKACQDLGISCHGYAETPPSFMRAPAQRRQQLELIKLTTLPRRSHRLSAANAAQSAAVQQYPPKGCWTCLLRRKRCDKRKPTCGVCEALGIACDGFAPPRPSFLTDPVARELRKAETRRYNKAQASRQHVA